jgi:hypothetical protein
MAAWKAARRSGAAEAVCQWRPDLVGGGWKVEQMKGRRDPGEREWRGMRFITNMDGENGDGDDSLQTANTTEGSCQNGTSNNYKK